MEPENLVNFLSLNELDSTKPLIRDHFRHARTVAMQKVLKQSGLSHSHTDLPSTVSSRPGLSESALLSEHDNTSLSNSSGSLAQDVQSRLKLFVLSPSVAEPQRYCRKGVMSETESLQAKHSAEYEFLIPAIGSAVSDVIAAHKEWQQHSNSLYVPHRKDSAELSEESTSSWAPDDRINNADASMESFSVFNTARAPHISFPDYVRRIVEYTYVSPSVLMIACLYVDRLLSRKPSLLLTDHNVFKVFASATRVASKVMDTRTLSNKNFARICGVSNTELNFLETYFMQFIELDLYVRAEEFYKYVEDLVMTSHSRHPSTAAPATVTTASPVSGGVNGKGRNRALPVVSQTSVSPRHADGRNRSRVKTRRRNPRLPVIPQSSKAKAEAEVSHRASSSTAPASSSCSTTIVAVPPPAPPRRTSRLPACTAESISSINIGNASASNSRCFGHAIGTRRLEVV